MHDYEDEAGESSADERHARSTTEFPVREYVGSMAAQLAQMARSHGDERLGSLLDAAAEVAARDPGG